MPHLNRGAISAARRVIATLALLTAGVFAPPAAAQRNEGPSILQMDCRMRDSNASFGARQAAGLQFGELHVFLDSDWGKQLMQSPIDGDPERIRQLIARFQIIGSDASIKQKPFEGEQIADLLRQHAFRLRLERALGLPVTRRATVADMIEHHVDDMTRIDRLADRAIHTRARTRIAAGSDPLAVFESRGPYALVFEAEQLPGFAWWFRNDVLRLLSAPADDPGYSDSGPVDLSGRMATLCRFDHVSLNVSARLQAINGGPLRERIDCTPVREPETRSDWELDQIDGMRDGSWGVVAKMGIEQIECDALPPFDEAVREMMALPCEARGTCKGLILTRPDLMLRRDVLLLGLGPLRMLGAAWLALSALLALGIVSLTAQMTRSRGSDAVAVPSNRTIRFTGMVFLLLVGAAWVLPYITVFVLLFTRDEEVAESLLNLMLASLALLGALAAAAGGVESLRIARSHLNRAIWLMWAALGCLGPLLLILAVLWQEGR